MIWFYSFGLALAFWGMCCFVQKRLVLWGMLLPVVAAVHFMHLDTAPFGRMVVICSVLLICMKGIVLAEWGGVLRWNRRLMFSFLWFGMDPTPFAARRRKLNWQNDALIGGSCFLVGLILCLGVAHLEIANILLMFVPLSIAFHYGVLRLLTAFWRLCGFSVRPLFRDPLKSRNLGDFWAKRWNLSYSQMMARVVLRPLRARFGAKVALLGVFFISGILHELAITLPVQSGYGLPTLYFAVHGVIVVIEPKQWPVWLTRSLAVLLVAAPLPLLFPALFTEEVIEYCLSFLNIF